MAKGRPKAAEGAETQGTRTDGALDDLMPISDEDLEVADESADAGPRRSRASLPPPLPPQARRTSAVPNAPPPAGRDSVPPKVPASAQSGTWRIPERASVLPPRERRPTPPPPLPSQRNEGPEVATMRRELGEARGLIARLRLQVRQREDRIADLQRELGDQAHRLGLATKHAEEARAELARVRDELRADLAHMRDELREAREHAVQPGDDLKRLPGVGPGFERALHAEGVTTFAQIAAWSTADVYAMAPRLRTKPGRILRDQWIEHARAIVEGTAVVADESAPESSNMRGAETTREDTTPGRNLQLEGAPPGE